MYSNTSATRRRGTVVPLVAVLIIVLFAFVALAIDLGIILMARNHCQNAADSAALAGARTFNGDSSAGVNYGLADVPKKAIAAAIGNSVLNAGVTGDAANVTTVNANTFTSGQVKVEVGAYAYYYSDDASVPAGGEGFYLDIPRVRTADPYSAVRTTITSQSNPVSFAGIFGVSGFDTSAKAVAIHRPRDVVIIMDLSGSMRFQSLPGTPMSGSNADPSATDTARTKSLNPETVYPQFGHYSDTTTAGANLVGSSSIPTGGGEYVDPSNISVETSSGKPICADFFKNNAGTAATAADVAFTRALDSYQTTPGGDNYKKKSGAATVYAYNVNQIVGRTDTNTSTTLTKDVSAEALLFRDDGDLPTQTGLNPAGGNNDPSSATATAGYGNQFNGYTQGPGYWGKTFFIWPPDPRGSSLARTAANFANNGAKDWRQRFFIMVNLDNSNTLYWLNQNRVLFDDITGYLKAPGEQTDVTTYYRQTVNGQPTVQSRTDTFTYRINYAAILHWLRNISPSPFPSQLRAGRICYYTAIPDPSTDTDINNRYWTTAPSSLGNNDRFWKEYIDFVLGVAGTGAGTYTKTNGGIRLTAKIGNGDLFSWSGTTFRISNKPAMTTTANAPFMDYRDNPRRPRHQLWFGPMTFVDWLGNYNTNKFWWPGNVHEAQCWSCKVGIQSAIKDIKTNHPNDFLSLVYFSSPKRWQTTGSATLVSGQHNRAKGANGRNYQQLIDTLWFPPTTVTGSATEITPYDADMAEVPRANGGTCPGMGFMLAYNQLSSSATNLRGYAQTTVSGVTYYRGDAGGLGPKGAQRLVIFESDGAPNTRAYETLEGSGADAYYPIRVKKPGNMSDVANVEWPDGGTYSGTEVTDVVQAICNLDTNTTTPGFSTARKKVQIHCIAFGSLFNTANSGTTQDNALAFMQKVQYIGNVQSAEATPLASYKRIYGTYTERIDKMKTAFTNIMQDGLQVTLIE